MSIARPSLAQIRDLSDKLGLDISDHEISSYDAAMQGAWDAYDVLDALPDDLPPVLYPRTSGRRPGQEENPLNAWYVKTDIAGAPGGRLSGKTVALKDNIALAGVPMMNGTALLEGFVPAYDATIVTRMLDAGATIKGKAVCQSLCFSGGSHFCDPAPVHNPHRHGYSAGGSSSGSAALVAAGEVDMAIGGDQGGSIRIPASYCGIYGMKPTHGLVPYTGAMPIENSIDHVGPMTATVADNALLLELLAGADGLDPRQSNCQPAAYTEALGKGVEGLRIGILAEPMDDASLQPGIAEKVRAAAAQFARLGAVVEDISVPAYRLAAQIWTPIAVEGASQQMMFGNGAGYNWEGFYDLALMDAHANWRKKPHMLSAPVKMTLIQAIWASERYNGRYYAKAQNVRRRIRAAFSEIFSRYDLLLSPTLPCVATPLPAPGAPVDEAIARAFEMVPFTSPADVVGHPAMTLPCGTLDGLPVGLMLTANHWQEATIYRAAAAYEGTTSWRAL